MSLQLVVEAYRTLLTPFGALETLTGARLSPLDVLGALRLALVMRQLRDAGYDGVPAHRRKERESRSFVKDLAVLMVVVYGGEAFTAPWLGLPPSFLTSPTVPLLFTAAHLAIHALPSVPPMSLEFELPFALLDGMTRTLLLTELVPGVFLNSVHPSINTSPFGLVFGSLLFANGGFFFVNLFSMLSPHGFSLATPSELQSYGWTTLDLWVAPIVTALYALFTHPEAQPFWKEANYSFNNFLKPANESLRPEGEPDHEMIRAVCAVGLASAFTVRALKNFGPAFQQKRKEKANVPSKQGALNARR